MSTYPPPYQFDRKATRRAAALQAKAQREAYKAQRELYRQQARGHRRHSVVGPLLLISTGVVALLVSTGKWSLLTFATVYGRWWPALLVLVGLIMLAEWALDQYTVQSGGTAPPMRRSIGGVIGLLIPLVFVGLAMRTVHDGSQFFHNGFSLNSDNFQEFFGERRTLPDQVLDETLPVTLAGATLSIDNPRGDITVTGKSPDGNLHVTVRKQVYSSDDDAQRKGDQLTPAFVAAGSTLTLNVPTVEGGSADLQVLVPDTLAVTLNANRGAIAVTGMKAAVSLTSNRGDVELRSVVGNVSAQVNHSSSSFSAHDVTGDVTLRGNLGDVALTDVSGQTNLEGDFYGKTHFERLRGPITFQTSRTHFTLARLDGTIDLDHSDISGSELVGPVNLKVKSRNISFDRTSGDLDLQNSNGSVDVTSATPGSMVINNTNGPVSLSVPEHAGLAIQADAQSGEITNELGLPVTKSSGHATLDGKTGDGRNRVTLRTTHANIQLNQYTPNKDEK